MSTETRTFRAAIVILNYETPKLTLDCLASLAPEMASVEDVFVVVVDNDSQDDSAQQIADAIAQHGWSEWAGVFASDCNAGFAGGNNIGIEAVPAKTYILLNSDTIVRPGAIQRLLEASDRFPDAGIIGPRLEWPDGSPQESAFRFRSPRLELIGAAGTNLVTRLAGGTGVAIDAREEPFEAQWVSFACVLIRGEVLKRVGMLDDGYFMYFEDIDLCRRAHRAGFRVLCWPDARVVHLRGGTSGVKSETAKRGRRPKYYYESRTRYFAKFYAKRGLWLTNWLWGVGRSVAWLRERVGLKKPHACENEWKDNWINFKEPMKGRKAA